MTFPHITRKPVRPLAVLIIALLTSTVVSGQTTWRRVHGGFDEDVGVAVRVGPSERIYVAGRTGGFGSVGGDIYLLELDGDGNRLWSRTIGGEGLEVVTDMLICPNGDLLLAGWSYSQASGYDGLLIRTDDMGSLLWQKTFGSDDWDFLHTVRQGPSDGFILCGQTFGFGSIAGSEWVLMVDANGEEVWSYVGQGQQERSGEGVAMLSDAGVVVAGSVRTDAGDKDGLLVKLDQSGLFDWEQTYGGDQDDMFRDVVPTLDGGYSMMGSTRSYSEFVEAYHVKVDGGGALQWFWNWGQIGDQEAYRHIELENGEFMSIGYTSTTGGGGKDFFLLKSAATGDFVFGRTFGGLDDEIGYSLDRVTNGYVCTGSTYSYGAGNADVFVVRTNLNGATQTEEVISSFDPLSVPAPPTSPSIALHPNPSSGTFNISSPAPITGLVLRDALGRVAERLMVSPGAHTFTTALPAGTYVAEAELAGGSVQRGRLIITRP